MEDVHLKRLSHKLEIYTYLLIFLSKIVPTKNRYQILLITE